MEFESLTAASGGTVELLEFSWPLLGDEEVRSAASYVVLLRPGGFLLCLPEGFLDESELGPPESAGDDPDLPGLRTTISASPIALSATGEWTAVADPSPIRAMLVDLPASYALALGALDSDSFSGQGFGEDPSVFPLASDVLGQAQTWILSVGGAASGYQTAVSEEDVPPKQPPKKAQGAKPKRLTLAQLASQQSSMMDVMSKLVQEIAAIRQEAKQGSGGVEQPRPATTGVPPGKNAVDLAAPLSSLMPPYQGAPKSLAHLLGPPPNARRQPPAAPTQVDLDAQLANGIIEGEMPVAKPSADLAAAVLAQSQALMSLVAQLSQGGDPILDMPASSTSVRGSVNRQRLQSELATHSGTFAQKVQEQAMKRMNPTGLLPPDQTGMCRYYERFGGFARNKELALVVWQVSQAFDLLNKGSVDGARDILSLLLVYLDQVNLDSGNTTIAWLLSLQSDPPQSLFQDAPNLPGQGGHAFTPLAEQKWLTTAISYLKEVDTITTRRAELRSKNPNPSKSPQLPSPAPPTAPAGPGDAAGTKKAQRAAAWAAKKAAAAAKAGDK
ncbi:unnamed protein product [Symbiodinium natans]|uniref:Uncharacterized protein n=1 Tax=Symbiodinium natans TaxID=878477 RepID=A0A812N9T2_9DINO|nr:unnamed protein product [Symbiodinium natans]